MNLTKGTSENFAYKEFIITIFLLILASHLLFQAYFNSLVANLSGLVILTIILYYKSIYQNRIIIFVFLLYFIAHFSILKTRGGAFNVVAFLTIIIGVFTSRKLIENRIKDPTITILLSLFIVTGILGYVFKHQAQVIDFIFGMLAFMGVMATFKISSKLILTDDRIKVFIVLTLLILFYNTFVNFVNLSRLVLFLPETLFIPKSALRNVEGEWASGTYGNPYVMGEDMLRIFVLLFVVYHSRDFLIKLSINTKIMLIALSLSAFGVVLSMSRSLFLLLLATVPVVLVIKSFERSRTVRLGRRLIAPLLLTFVTLIIIQSKYDVLHVIQRLELVNLQTLTLQGVASGEDINRSYAFDLMDRRIEEENFFIGYGYGAEGSNHIAWFGDYNFNRVSPHSLYYGIIILFGFPGLLIFLAIYLVTIRRLLVVIAKDRSKIHSVLAVSLSVGLILFLINQYKSDNLSVPSYMMVEWLYLGIANALYNTYKLTLVQK